MRNILIVACILFFSCNNSNKNSNQKFDIKKPEVKKINSENNTSNKIYSKDLFRINKIDSVKTFYVIYSNKRNVDYKIVSKKISIKKQCKKITKGDFLNLSLVSIVPDTSTTSYKLDGISYDGVVFEFEGDSILDIYESENLVGLCYFPENN